MLLALFPAWVHHLVWSAERENAPHTRRGLYFICFGSIVSMFLSLTRRAVQWGLFERLETTHGMGWRAGATLGVWLSEGAWPLGRTGV